MADSTKMEKEELVDYIRRPHRKRRELNRKLKTARELLVERASELPAADDVSKAKEALAIAIARWNDQKDADDTYLKRDKVLDDLNEELHDTEGSLSDALSTYMVEHKSKTIHLDENEPETIDRIIKVEVTIGKKVAVQLDMFEEHTKAEEDAES